MKRILKRILNKNSKLYIGLSYLYNFRDRYWKPSIIDNTEKIIYNYINKKDEFSFIQIGSNDGKSNDPLYDFIKSNKCKGVLIEPVNYLYEQLKLNYQGIENIYFENIAISTTNSEKEFYTIKESNDISLPNWYNQLSSFNLETILASKDSIPNLEQLIIKQNIQTKTVQFIIDKYKFKDLDILHIDTEGYDFEIIKTIDFTDICPSVLLFENIHLSNIDYKACLRILRKYYKSIKRNKTGDTICYKKKDKWKKLKE